jgi:hypothetical protein
MRCRWRRVQVLLLAAAAALLTAYSLLLPSRPAAGGRAPHAGSAGVQVSPSWLGVQHPALAAPPGGGGRDAAAGPGHEGRERAAAFELWKRAVSKAAGPAGDQIRQVLTTKVHAKRASATSCI